MVYGKYYILYNTYNMIYFIRDIMYCMLLRLPTGLVTGEGRAGQHAPAGEALGRRRVRERPPWRSICFPVRRIPGFASTAACLLADEHSAQFTHALYPRRSGRSRIQVPSASLYSLSTKVPAGLCAARATVTAAN